MEDAISQLQDLGVTRGQAKKALARYNNDVARAADFIFSGNYISDDEAEEAIVESDEALALRLNAEEEATMKSFQQETIPENVKSESKPMLKETSIVQDSSNWSVIPFKENNNTESFIAPASNRSSYVSKESLLTWWKDPEDPSERIALDDLPIGLRPPSYNFAYSPILLQALFHVSSFQRAVVSFRPVPYAWGSSKNFWKGFGEPVPGYIMREVVTKRKVAVQKPPPAAIINDNTEDLISFDNLHISDSNSINENIVEKDLPPLIVESITPPLPEEEYVDHVDNELQLMPKSLQALSEMQKLFAFLGNTNRLYGNVSHYVRALNTKMTSNSSWEFSDKTFEAFLEMVINALVDADEQSDSALDPHYVPIFRSLFLIKAKIEYGNDYEEEEVYFITMNADKNMNSFHDCLDPLVFESYERDMEADPSISDEEEEEISFKLTTFKQIPPIIMVVLYSKPDFKSNNSRYIVDKTIYMDRYLTEKRDKVLEGFKQMDSYRKDILNSRREIDKLKSDNNLSMDKRDLLAQTLNYFEAKENDEEDEKEEDLDILKEVLNSVKDQIEKRLDDLENTILDQREKIHHVFDTDDMKEKEYELRASFHTDGKSGTGHYWAYIWVEPSEQSLLEDIPSEGGWFKFCDAYVTASTEFEVLNEPVQPFSLMYVDKSTPHYSKEQIYECLPEGLKEFMMADNQALDAEIYARNHPVSHAERDNVSLVSTGSEDEVLFTEKTESHVDLESSSATFDDNISVGTAVNQNIVTDQQQEQQQEQQQQYSFTGQGYNRLKDRVNSKIVQVAAYPNDDYRLLKSFEDFLARTQNQLLLEHLYLLYSSDQLVDDVETVVIDEEGSKKDDDLKIVWREYESYLAIGEMIVQALSSFIKEEYQFALQSLLDAKRLEAAWKTQVMLDIDVSHAYSGLATISFNNIVETYGKQCLKLLNHNAFKKASNEAYRTRGLEDAIRIAYQAQTIIGPDNVQNDDIYHSLGELWLTFTEQQQVPLTDAQANLLNTLVLTYLEGQSSTHGIQSRSESPVQGMTIDDNKDELPLWQMYVRVCSESKKLLEKLNE